MLPQWLSPTEAGHPSHPPAAYAPGGRLTGVAVIIFLPTSLQLTPPHFLDPTGVNARLNIQVRCGQDSTVPFPEQL